MAGSAAEAEIRNAVEARLRELHPSARIIHELNVAGHGSNRLDLAAVTTDRIIGVEIKSERDVLTRLDDQWDAFSKVCDWLIVAAHEKHFVEVREEYWREDVESIFDLNHKGFVGNYQKRQHVWRYPKPEKRSLHDSCLGNTWDVPYPLGQRWHFPLRSSDLLQMLWGDELRAECRATIPPRACRGVMINAMADWMTGREVRQAVCRQLRGRQFVRADPAIPVPSKTLELPFTADKVCNE